MTGAVGTNVRGREALPECREESGSLPGGPAGVRSLFWIAGKGREGRERSGVLPRGLGEVGRPSQGARRGWEALPEGWKGLGGRLEESGVPPIRLGRSGVPPGGPGGLGRPPIGPDGVWRSSQRAGKGPESLLEGRAVSGGLPGGLGEVGRSIRMAGGWKPSQQGWEESGVPHWGREGSRGPPGGPVGVRGPSGELGGVASAGKGREFLPEGREGLGGPPERARRCHAEI